MELIIERIISVLKELFLFCKDLIWFLQNIKWFALQHECFSRDSSTEPFCFSLEYGLNVIVYYSGSSHIFHWSIRTRVCHLHSLCPTTATVSTSCSASCKHAAKVRRLLCDFFYTQVSFPEAVYIEIRCAFLVIEAHKMSHFLLQEMIINRK